MASSDPGQLIAIDHRPDVLIAADSGVRSVIEKGWIPDRVVGDMDSASADELAAAERGGAVVERHPVAKDESDLELALDTARRLGVTDLQVVVRAGGRLDHQIANLMVLAAPEFAGMRIEAAIGAHRVWVVRSRRSLDVAAGSHLGLHAVGGAALVTSVGVAFPLAAEELSPFSARGIANRATASPVTIDVERGVLLVVSSPASPG